METTIAIRSNTAAIVEAFYSSLDKKEATRNQYRKTLQLFIHWLEVEGLDIRNLSTVDLLKYKQAIYEGGKKATTAANYINTLRQFYNWAEANKHFPNIAKTIHPEKIKREFRKEPLTIEQSMQLLDHAAKNGNARDFAMVNLLLHTGLRCIEIARADVGDITFKGGKPVLLIQGKGAMEKDNFVVLEEGSLKPLQQYLSTRNNAKDHEPLFACNARNNNGGRLTTRAISGIVKTTLRGIGLDSKALTAHSLRHTAAVNTLRAGGKLEDVQFMLRHSDPATTQIYTRFLDNERRLQSGAEGMLAAFYQQRAKAI
jgi:site-specific recombinase XerD